MIPVSQEKEFISLGICGRSYLIHFVAGREKVTAFLLGPVGSSGINASQLSQLYGAVVTPAAIPSCEPAAWPLPEAKQAASFLAVLEQRHMGRSVHRW